MKRLPDRVEDFVKLCCEDSVSEKWYNKNNPILQELIFGKTFVINYETFVRRADKNTKVKNGEYINKIKRNNGKVLWLMPDWFTKRNPDHVLEFLKDCRHMNVEIDDPLGEIYLRMNCFEFWQ